MIALLAAVAAGAANVALVAFMADRVASKGSAAGEFVAIINTAPAAPVRAVQAGNENVPAQAAKLAA
ncbi:hypothetical protein [Methylorubrum aminovorans]|nr:hypothetical protein C0214_07015 [Methylobacterium sp. DM1]